MGTSQICTDNCRSALSLVSKKILFTVTNDLSYDQRMHRICTTVHSRGAQVTLVGRLRKHSKDLKQFPFATKRLKCFFEKGKLFYLEFNFRLLLYILVKRFDMVCAIDLDTLLPATLVAKVRRKKLGYDAHEFFTEVPEVVHRKAVRYLWNGLAKFCIPKTDFRYTVGPKLAAKFEEKYGAPFQVVRNVPVYTPGLSAEKDSLFNFDTPFILYQGALNVGRGLECLIHAAESLMLSVVIAGEGDLSNELRLLVKDKGLEHKVLFTGFVEPSDLKELTRKAFLGYNLLENMGLSEYEAAQAEQTFYAHDRRVVRELAEHWKPGVPASRNTEYVERARELEKDLETALMELYETHKQKSA